MDQTGNCSILEIGLNQETAGLAQALSYIARRVLAILALFAFIYALLAAEVELARIEHVTEPMTLTW